MRASLSKRLLGNSFRGINSFFLLACVVDVGVGGCNGDDCDFAVFEEVLFAFF